MATRIKSNQITDNVITADDLHSAITINTTSTINSGNITSTGYIEAAGNISTGADSGRLRAGASNEMQLYFSGSHGLLTSSTGNFTIDSAGDIFLNADGADIILADDTVEFGRLARRVGDFVIKAETVDKDIIFRGTKSGTPDVSIDALVLDMSADGSALFNSDVGMVTGHSSGKFAVMSAAVHGTYDFYNNGSSYFNGSVTVDDVLTISGSSGVLRGPATFTIDPATHSDNTGTVVIAGDLQVDGTTTTINSTTVNVDDLNIQLATGAINAAAANGAGITIDGAGAIFEWNNAQGSMTLNKELRLDNNKGLFFSNAAANATLGLKADASDNITFRQNGSWDRLVIKNTGVDVAGVLTPSGGIVIPGALNSPPTIRLDMAGNLSQGNVTGKIEFYNADSTDNTAGVFGIIQGVAGPSGGEGSLQFLVDMPSEGADASSLAMHLNGNGYVGIGTDAPSALLHVKKDVDSFIMKVENDGNSPGTVGNSYTDASDGLWIDTRWNTATNTIFKVTSNSGTADMMVIKGDGKVGIGTAQPDLTLHVDGANGYPATSGSTPVGHIAIRAKNESSSHGAHIGVANAAPWGTWIQAQDAGNLATVYPLLLNPNGGNVGIGTQSPDADLHISGTNDNNLIIQNSTYQASSQNTEAALRFKVTASSDAERAKAGVIFKNDGSAYGRGDLHFAVDSNDDNGNVDLNDSKMVITHEGRVAIGTTDPSTSKLRVYNSTVTGNTRLHVHNDKNGDAAELRLEGKRTSNNDTGQLLYVNSGNVVARISANSSADDGDLRFYTSATGTGQNIVEAMRIATTGQVNIGETPALIDGTNNPRHVLHIGGTTVNPSYEQLSMSPGSNSGGENATKIRMANVGNDFYLTNNYYNWGTNRFDETNEGQAFFKMGEDGRFSFGGRTSASTSSPVYNAGIGYDGSISAGSSSTMVNGLAKMNVVGNSDTSDEDVELRIVDNDTTTGSAVPSISFYKGTNTGPERFADIRANDVNGVIIRDGSGNDLFTVGLTGLVTQPGATRISDSSYASPTNWVAGDWVTTHTVPYGEVVCEVGIEWNSLDASGSAHHGWNTLKVGSHYSSYHYGWETTLELLDHTAHNSFYFDQWRVIRPDGYSNGNDILLQGRLARNVTAGTLRSWVLNRVGSNNSAVSPVTPVVNNSPTGNTTQARIWTYSRMKKALYGDMAITGDLSIGRLKGGEDTIVEIVTDEAGSYDAILQLGSGQSPHHDITNEGFQLWYDNSTGHTYLNNTYTDGDMIFVTASSAHKATTPQRMKIDHDGWVVVGTGNAAATDNVSLKDGRILIDKSNDWNLESGLGSSNGSHIRFKHGTTDRGSITTSTSGTTFNTASDIRLKDNIKTIENGKEKLLKLNPVTHTWKEDESGVTVHGFIAQEVQDIIPEAIAGDEDTMMSMDYGRITPVIVAALQDALKEIEELKSRISDMENK